ncbi:MAG: branched-chain amino acid permease [Solirubrobacterales bacterium]|jgi:4-azaleucine resistance transporter AzlC|nr:branched-chain amino acid permease [Solirubrobacterales bacterium]
MRAAAPLAVAVGLFGVPYGVLARDELGIVPALVFSATTFAGSAQMAVVSLLGSGGVTAAIVAGLLLNARYLPIGISVAPSLPRPLWRRVLTAQLVVDESWAIANRGGGRFDGRMLLGAGLVLYAAWMLGSAAGLVGGSLLGDPKRLGLDAAFPALFLALLAGQIRDRLSLVAALLGGAIALALVPFVPAGVPIIAASVVCLLGLRPVSRA